MEFTPTKPLKRNIPLYQQAYQEIRKAILTGKFTPGTKISENSLAEQFQISRTPLREAIRQLQSEGLLVSDAISTSVVELDAQDFEELCLCRLILEKEAVTLSTQKITDKDIQFLEQLLTLTEEELNKEKEINYFEVLNYNTQFHEQIINCCGNKRLIQLLSQTRSLLLLYRANALMNAGNNLDMLNEHWGILNAIKERDIPKAIETIEMHLKGDLERGRQFSH